MDDIQIWLYIIFGAFYFLSRILKKKKPEPPEVTGNEETSKERTPMSFEDLLKEITEERKVEKPQKTQVIPEKKKFESAAALIKKEEEKKEKDFVKEGETRHFADEESRKIFEKSIQMAKASGEEKFRSFDQYSGSTSLTLQRLEDETENVFAKELRASLKNKQDVKKAIILNEILTRKY